MALESLSAVQVRHKVERHLKVIVADVNLNHGLFLQKELEAMNCVVIFCWSGKHVLEKFE